MPARGQAQRSFLTSAWRRRLVVGAAAAAAAFILVVLDVLFHGLLWRLDHEVAAAVMPWPAGVRSAFGDILSAPAHVWMRGLVLAVAGGGFLLGHRWRDALALAAGIAGGEGLVQALKALIGRMRPDGGDGAIPSGHAAGAVLTYVLLVALIAGDLDRRQRLAAWTGAAALALVVGVARVLAGIHWVTDVMAGWALGVAIVILVLLRRRAAPA